MSETRWAFCGLVCCLLANSACHRSSLSSLVPTLHIQLQAKQVRASVLEDLRLSTSISGWLRFQSRVALQEQPLRVDMRAEAEAFPCTVNEVECIEEFSEGESGVTKLLGDLE